MARHTSAGSLPPPPHCPGPALQGQPCKAEVFPGLRGLSRWSGSMPLKLVGKALFKVCVGPMGTGARVEEGLLSKSVIFLGLGCGSEINFCLYLLLRMN